MKKIGIIIVLSVWSLFSFGQGNLISNIGARTSLNLNGKWQYIVDPYETGFYDYRYKELNERNGDAYWNTDVQANRTEKKEHGYIDKYSINVPGDWNHQQPGNLLRRNRGNNVPHLSSSHNRKISCTTMCPHKK